MVGAEVEVQMCPKKKSAIGALGRITDPRIKGNLLPFNY